jgi:hypothetical protein
MMKKASKGVPNSKQSSVMIKLPGSRKKLHRLNINTEIHAIPSNLRFKFWVDTSSELCTHSI